MRPDNITNQTITKPTPNTLPPDAHQVPSPGVGGLGDAMFIRFGNEIKQGINLLFYARPEDPNIAAAHAAICTAPRYTAKNNSQGLKQWDKKHKERLAKERKAKKTGDGK